MTVKNTIFICLYSVILGVPCAHAAETGYFPESVTGNAAVSISKEVTAPAKVEQVKTGQKAVTYTAEGESGKQSNNREPIEIIVTARKIPEDSVLVPRSVEEITGKEIEDAGYDRLGNLLDNVSGISVYKTGGYEGSSTLMLRGASSTQTLVLVNGVPMNDMMTGDFNLNDISLSGNDRIEIIKGGLSSVYGANAMAGVVNVITKPALTKPFKSVIQYGSNDFTRSTIGLNYELFTGFVLSGNTFMEKSSGYVTNTDYSKDGFNGKISYDLDKNSADFDFSYLKRLMGVPGTVSYPTLYDRQNDENYTLGLNDTFDLGAIKLSTAGFLKNQDLTYNAISMMSVSRHKKTEIQGSEMAVYDGGDLISIVSGYEYNNKSINSTDIGNKIAVNNALLANASVRPLRPLSLNGGIRWDNNTGYGNMFSWNIGSKYALTDDIDIHATIDNSFSAPTLGELYWPITDPYVAGNPDLKTEKSASYEIGITKQNGNFTGSLVYFHRDVRDLISYNPDPYTYKYIPTNIDKALIWGIELGAGVTLFDNLEIKPSLTYMKATDVLTGKQLPYRPEMTFSCTATISLPHAIKIMLLSDFISEKNTDLYGGKIAQYCLLDVNAGWNINNGLRFTCRLENLLDNKNYQVVKDYVMPGRTITVGIEMKL
jgi:outer membrane cobalamin receptor